MVTNSSQQSQVDLTEQLISPTNLSQVSLNGEVPSTGKTRERNYLPSQGVDADKVKEKLFERRKSNPTLKGYFGGGNKPATPNNAARKEQPIKFRLHRERKMEAGDESEDKYETLRQLGRGAFGSVQLVKNKKENSLYAIKSMAYSDKGAQETASREITCLLMFEHPFIIRLVDIFRGKQESKGGGKIINVVLTYCDGGDLAKLIKQEKKNHAAGLDFNTKVYNQQNCLRWFAMSCLALDYLHSNGIIHRDIKPDNILLSAASKNCRLGDFGLAKVLDNKDDMAVTEVGTTYYISPEIVASQPYSYPTDVWSLGCVMYELFTLQLPFYGDSTAEFVKQLMYMEVKMDEPKGRGDGTMGNSGAEAYQQPVLKTPDEIWKIIGRMLEKDQEKRITIKEILASRIMRKVTASVIHRHKPDGLNTRQIREEGLGLQAQYNDILTAYEEEFGVELVEESSHLSVMSTNSNKSDGSKGSGEDGERNEQGARVVAEKEASAVIKKSPPSALPPVKSPGQSPTQSKDKILHEEMDRSTHSIKELESPVKAELNTMSVSSTDSAGSKGSQRSNSSPPVLPRVPLPSVEDDVTQKDEGGVGEVGEVSVFTPKATERLQEALGFGKETSLN